MEQHRPARTYNQQDLNKIYGISLGPGDPELLTLKSLRILRASDIIFYPGSITSAGTTSSFVLPLLQYHQLDPGKLEGFFLKMQADREDAERTYEQTAAKILKAHQGGKQISIVCEGDLSFYASFSYLLNRLQDQHLEINLVPGVNSFSLGAAMHQIPIALQHEKVAVLPMETEGPNIAAALQDFDTVILMKIRAGWKKLWPYLVKSPWKCYYCEKLGTTAEFISSDMNKLKEREIPYFSLLIIKK